MAPSREAALARFRARVRAEPDGCHRWLGSFDKDGYGVFWVDGRNVAAHAFAYRALVGPLTPGQQPDHLCRRPWCVNPAHLEPVSALVNTLRGDGPTARNARKTHCRHGHPLRGENLVVRHRGGRPYRVCRECARRKDRRLRARKKWKRA